MKHRHKPETEAKVTELWGQGLTVRQIGEATGLTMDSVDHLRARLKLPLRFIRRKPDPDGAYIHRSVEQLSEPFRVATRERLVAGAEPLPPMHPISWGAIAL